MSGIAKDLTKMSSKSSVKLLAPDKNNKLFQWVTLMTGSKNAVKGFGFLLGSLLLAFLGFQLSLILMAGLLSIILILVFVYLNDVYPGNGQLQVIDKTNSFFFKLKNIILSNYFSISDLFTGKRRYQSLDDLFIKKLTRKLNIVDIVSSRGGIFFVNSSSIHRACPIESNERYALTFYMNKI